MLMLGERSSTTMFRFSQLTGPIGLGLEIQWFGFDDAGKEPGRPILDLRLLRGHVTRSCEDNLGFGRPDGFSGTPLLVDSAVVGMLHNNLETKIGHHSILDETENGNRYKKKMPIAFPSMVSRT